MPTEWQLISAARQPIFPMRISVIVPVRNEENSIVALLDGLISQSLPPSEIVITDGGSTDATVSILETYIERGAPIRLIRAGPALPGRGRNLAASQASGEWLAFIDAGVRPEATWLESLSRRAADPKEVDVVYGSYEPITDTFFKECAAIAYVSPAEEVAGRLMRSQSIVSSLVRRTVWESVGGFPEHLRSAEDLLFMNKITEENFRVGRAPDALVHWDLQPTIGQTFKRFVKYSRHNIRAGLWNNWQAPLMRRYAFVLMAALPAIVLRGWWLVAPLLVWLALLIARGLVAIWRNRLCSPANTLKNLLRLLVIVSLLAVLDLATIVGTIQWVLKDKLHLGSEGDGQENTA